MKVEECHPTWLGWLPFFVICFHWGKSENLVLFVGRPAARFHTAVMDCHAVLPAGNVVKVDHLWGWRSVAEAGPLDYWKSTTRVIDEDQCGIGRRCPSKRVKPNARADTVGAFRLQPMTR